MDEQKTPTLSRLLELTKHLKFVIGLDEPDTGQLVDHTLKYMSVVNRHIRRFERAAKDAKVVGKPTK